MCYSVVTIFGIILIIFVYYCSAISSKSKILSKPSNSSKLVNLPDIMTDLLYSSLAHPQTIIISYDKNNRSDLKLLTYLQPRSSVITLTENFSTEEEFIHTKKIDAVILHLYEYHSATLTRILSNLSIFLRMNRTPTFFIIYDDLDDGSFALKISVKMWKFRIMSYFICLNEKRKTMIYTFNPYTDWAPTPWQKIYRASYIHGKWTLLVYKYQREFLMNNSLAFDRTQLLSKYKLFFGYVDSSFVLRGPQRKHECSLGKFQKNYIEAIMKTLKLPGIFYCFPYSRNIPNYKMESGKRIFQSEVDIISGGIVAIFNSHAIYDFERTLPTLGLQWGILAISHGYKTPIEKIRDFYGIWVLLFTVFVLLVTFVVIYLFEQRRIYFATFEIIRILINAGLYTRMDTISLRLFFTVIFIYFLIMQATFNGNLSHFLTKPTLRRHPETLKDLKELGYKQIYGVHSLNYSISIEMKFTSTNRCWEHVGNRKDTACIDNHDFLRAYAMTSNHTQYYLSQNPFGSFYHYFYVRSNWALADRINQAIMRVWQSGLQLYWSKMEFSKVVMKAHVRKASSLFVYATIKFDNLIFAFTFLGAGLLCATLVFIVELGIA